MDVFQIIDALKRKGYAVFDADNKEYNLNLVGVRSGNLKANSFDDMLYMFWLFAGRWRMREYQITTDPGLYWLKNPMNVEGTAILKEGQYKGLWEIGLHKGQYKALVQKNPCTVIRDANRDDKLNIVGGKEETGTFGINLHRANANVKSKQVDKWSAGCQVFANPEDYRIFMEYCEKARRNFGNSFTYTLMKERDLVC